MSHDSVLFACGFKKIQHGINTYKAHHIQNTMDVLKNLRNASILSSLDCFTLTEFFLKCIYGVSCL